MEAARAYLSICALYRDHATYLREWIEFHRLVGVDRFFLYDNESSDDHEEVLAPYVRRGIVEVNDWPTPTSVRKGAPWGIIPAFDDCLGRHRDDSRWIAFLDVDEFLFSPTGRPLPDILRGFERFPAVEVSRLDFGPSGHRTRPAGLVIESYLRRRAYGSPENFVDLEHVKSIVDPTRVERARNGHGFFYTEGRAVYEDGERAGDPPGSRRYPQASLLRINHYVTKSEEEYEIKEARWAALGLARRPPSPRLYEWLSAEQDEAITAYVPALRAVLGDPPA
jgi:hypothetical protein